MELTAHDQMFSRQGKASTHLHPEFSTGPKPRPQPKLIEPIKMSDLKSMLIDLQQKRLNEESEAKNKPKPLTSSFKSVSRESHEFAFRNKTESPKVGNYSPRFTVVEPRATHALKLIKPSSVPKERLIYLPSCLNTMACSFTNRTAETAASKSIKRNAKLLKEFQEELGKLQKIDRNIAKKPGERLQLPIQFDRQKPRSEFVKETDPPNDKRFDYVDNNSPVNARHKRVQSLPFNKILPRREFFEEKPSLSPYDVKTDMVKEKISRIVLDFSKVTARKPLVLEHMLKTPVPVENEKVQAAYKKQSNVKGSQKIPLMQTLSPRDDIMYRTTEMYMLNVPERQSALSAPRFMGVTSPSITSRTKFRSLIEY